MTTSADSRSYGCWANAAVSWPSSDRDTIPSTVQVRFSVELTHRIDLSSGEVNVRAGSPLPGELLSVAGMMVGRRNFTWLGEIGREQRAAGWGSASPAAPSLQDPMVQTKTSFDEHVRATTKT